MQGIMNQVVIDRRTLLRSAAVLGLAGAATAAAPFRHPLGVQLYTVRNVIGKAEEETLRRIAELGYTELETTGQNDLGKIGPILAKYKLQPVSTHLDSGLLKGSAAPDLSKSIETAHRHGVKFLVFPYLPPDQRGDADGYRKLADKLNVAGKQCQAAGLTFCYHNHAFEFGGAKGQRPIDILEERLDKKLVNFELDLFWVSVAGNDPVEMLQKYRGRVPLVHLKDKLKGAPVMFDERVPKETFQEVGSGTLDFPAILKASEKAGVKHYFVEQDQTPGDPVDSLAKSYRYLRSVSV
jgi:sugar phosphate isomerase/epimerase